MPDVWPTMTTVAVHVPTAKDEETKGYIRMRDGHKLALKKVKQQILAFCLRHNCSFPGNNHWTQAHLKWLREIKLGDIYQECWFVPDYAI